jgi:Cys-rich repeat protein
MIRSSTATCWSFAVACLGIACGTDAAGTGVSQRDSGNLPFNDAAVGVSPQASGGDSGSGSGGMSSGSSSGASAGDAGGGETGGNSAATGDASSATSGEGGSAAASSGADGGGASVAIDSGMSGGGALCGPNSTMSCNQGQYCDPSLGCVSCLMDSQCPASMRWCVQGSCVQCRTNTDCGSGTTPACYPADHSCHAACLTNQQCQGNSLICNVTTGACVGCNSSHDCPTSQPVCDSVTQQCVQCATSADCAGTATPACLRNRCVQCATNADCSGATPYCSAGGDSGPRCVQCVQDTQCPPSAPKCNSGTCGMSSG